MPNPVFARLRVGGLLYNDALWSIGMAFGLQNPNPIGQSMLDPFASLQTDVQGVLEDWVDLVKGNASGAVLPGVLVALLSSAGDVRTIRASRVGENGRETEVAEVTITPPVKGQSGANQAVQTAVVASLLTGRPGASYRGRLYWPALNAGLSSGALTNPAPVNIAEDTGTFLHQCAVNLGTALGQTTGVRPAVVSTTRNTMTEITTVRCGNRLDTQRRRRGGEQESYSSSAVPT